MDHTTMTPETVTSAEPVGKSQHQEHSATDVAKGVAILALAAWGAIDLSRRAYKAIKAKRAEKDEGNATTA